MKKLISKMLSTALVALMAINVLALPSWAWDQSLIKSETTFQYSSNGSVTQSTNWATDANGVWKNTGTTFMNSAGQRSYKLDADGTTIAAVWHYNNAGNCTSVDFTVPGDDGAPHTYTTTYIGTEASGISVTVDNGKGTLVKPTEGQTGGVILPAGDGAVAGATAYTPQQIQDAYDKIVAAGSSASFESQGIHITSFAISGAWLAKLSDDQVSRLLNLDTTSVDGTANTSPGYTLGYKNAAGQTVMGSVTIDGVTYGRLDNGQLCRADGQALGGVFGTWSANADGSMTVTVAHNTMGGNTTTGWLGTAVINADGTVRSATGTAGTKPTTAIVLKDSAVICGGKLYALKEGKLYNADGDVCGTYNATTKKFHIGLDIPAIISQFRDAINSNLSATFNITYKGDKATQLDYFDSTIKNTDGSYGKAISINLAGAASSNGTVAQNDPLVTGKYTTRYDEATGKYYLVVTASQINMYDGNGEQQADGEEILVEVDKATFEQLSQTQGQEITIAGYVTQSVDGHLTMTTHNNETGTYEKNFTVGAEGTSLKAFMATGSTTLAYFNQMLDKMSKVWSSSPVTGQGYKNQWNWLVSQGMQG